MSKRFTDTGKWEDPWFRGLPVKFKAIWNFLCERCDAAGVWKVDPALATFLVGVDFVAREVLEAMNYGKVRIIELSHEKWYLPDFVGFQYGDLSPSCRPHRFVLALMDRHQIKGYQKGLDTLKDKDKDKDQDKDKDKEPLNLIIGGVKGGGAESMTTEQRKRFLAPSPKEAQDYAESIGFRLDGARFVDFYEARGWKYKGGVQMKNWKAAVRTWKRGSGYGENGTEQVGGGSGGGPDRERRRDLDGLSKRIEL